MSTAERPRAFMPSGLADATMARLFPKPDPFVTDPVLWVEKKLNKPLWSMQRRILEAVRDYRYVAVQSCHGPGKSFTASCAASWWIDVHELGSQFLVTTAPSWPQVNSILWREIRRRHREGDLPGRITQDCHWHMGAITKRDNASEELVAMGRKPADYDESTFQGIHARYFMAVLDEAGGIPESLWNSVLALATNENSRILAIGNPDDPNSRFAKICRPGSGWHVIKISAYDTPLFTGEPVTQEMAESLVSPLWVEDRKRDWGEGSPIWQAKVLGEFPDVSDEYLISPALIAKCQNVVDLPGLELGKYGLDIARFGTDYSVMYRNRGGVVRLAKAWSKKDTMTSAGLAAQQLNSHGDHKIPCHVDIIGLGAGVFDRLRELGHDVVPHQGSQRAHNPAKFKNRRSEVWWTFRELMEEGLIDLDPADERLAAQLGSVKWTVDSAGRIEVESKEDILERGLPSPDHADAAVMSAIRETPMIQPNTATIAGDLLRKVM